MTVKIIPTVFATSTKEFSTRLSKIRKISSSFQIDVMDGKLVKATSVQLKSIPKLLKDNWEAHLMVKNPVRYIKPLKKRGCKKVIVHIEATQVKDALISIKKEKMIPFVAINPNTPIVKLIPIKNKIKGILCMGVIPGKEKQKFHSSVYKKIKTLRKIYKLPIQVDGGITPANIRKVARAGASIINSGSFISTASNPRAAFSLLKKSAN